MKTRLLMSLLLLSAPASAQSYTYSTLTSFPPVSQTAPSNPEAHLAIDDKGNLYGTSGGAVQGTVFKVTPTGSLTVLHSFSGPDGAVPESGVVFDKAGNLYGTTQNGGAHESGTVYKLTPGNEETVLYSFTGTAASGNYPTLPVTLDSAGNVYGYIFYTDNGSYSSGTIYKVTPKGKYSNVYIFGQNQGYEGFNPVGSMILDQEGNFYGAASEGGDFNTCGLPDGVLFKMTPDYVYSVLYTFCSETGGPGNPDGKLTQDAAGNMFGSSGGGIYRTTQSGDVSLVNSCCGVSANGRPQTLVLDSAGNIYGTVQASSDTEESYVFEISQEGTEAVLYTSPSTAQVGDGVVLDSAGNLYGTTFNGGVNGTGSIFKLTKHTD